MIIDAHMHVGFKRFKPKDVIAYLDKNHIEKCWLLTWEEINPIIPNEYTHLHVEDVFETYEKYPSRIIPMYAPDPRSADLENILNKWHKKGIKGCGELKVSLPWNSNEIYRLLACINKLKIPLVFHMQGSSNRFKTNYIWEQLLAKCFDTNKFFGMPKQIMNYISSYCPPLQRKKTSMSCYFPGYLYDFVNLEKILIEFPCVNFVGHGPLFWKAISNDDFCKPSVYPQGTIKGEGIICNLLSDYDNLYADISGGSGFNALIRDKSFAKYFLTQYDKKILYGTDNYELGLKELLNSLNLPQKTYNRIYFENAASLVQS